MTEWRPRIEKRSVGRLVVRWANVIVATADISYRLAQERGALHKQRDMPSIR